MSDSLSFDERMSRYILIKAMEIIVRNVNDESYLMNWLQDGIADGDIDYNSFGVSKNEISNLEYYDNDTEFRNLMNLFLDIITKVKKNGGLYNSGVCSE